jgi:hypothetical protein
MKTIAQQLNIKEFPFEIIDKQGNIIYFEGKHGYWYKREYDSQGNEIYFQNSFNYWFKSEYDSNGNEIYFEDSEGELEDNRPTCEGKVIQLDGINYKLTLII